jgi:hypothetical protein
MKWILFVLLTVSCAGQTVSIAVFDRRPGRLYITKYVAPSGKLVKTEKRFVSDSTIDFVDQIEKKTVILKTGCPVCGSDNRKTMNIVALVEQGKYMEIKENWYNACLDCGTLYTGRRRK